MIEIIIGSIAFVGGGIISYFVLQKALKTKNEMIVKEAQTEAEVIKKDKILQAKEKFLQLKTEHEKQINSKNNKLLAAENKFKQKENTLNQRMDDFQRKKKEVDAIRDNLNHQIDLVDKKSEELEKAKRQQVEQLQEISGMSAEEAKNQLIDSLKEVAKTEAMSYVNEIMEEAKMSANMEAKKVVVKTIQRVATETAIENSVTIFHIESDEIKGRIIGREGRNIRALEAATGIEIIVDDTPKQLFFLDLIRFEEKLLDWHFTNW